MDLRDKYIELFDLLKKYKNKEFMKEVDKLMETNKYFDINIYDDDNKQFLNYAIIMNNVEVVKFLIDKNVRIDTENEDIPLFTIPIYYKYDDIMRLLLERSKNTVGKSLVDYRDNMYKTPLHHAIINKYEYGIDLLLENGANVNIIDKEKNNALFYAIRSRRLNLCQKIIKYISNINARSITGENCLHISCNLQLYDITELLLEHKIMINVHDNTNEVTPLHYCVLLNNTKLTKLLISHDANLNLQDIYGNTPLHYSIVENNEIIFNEIMDHGLKSGTLNINLWNIEGNTPLHLILLYNNKIWNKYVETILEKSNLNIQNKDGNSAFYYLVTSGLWEKYIYVLKKKKINIFLKNKDNEYIFDVVNPINHELFFDMITDSYMYTLKNNSKNWSEEIDIICSKKVENMTNEDKKWLVKNIKKNKKDTETITENDITMTKKIRICKEKILQKIKTLIHDIKNDKSIECYEKSFPMIRPTMCITIEEGKELQYCTFTGTLLDVLFGLIYLLKKHSKNVCSILSDNIGQKDVLSKQKYNNNILNNRNELRNFEIVWTNKKLHFDPNFVPNFNECLKSQKKFIIIPLGIEMKEGSHAGYLIYDKTRKELERFETYGGSMSLYGTYYDSALLDEKLELKFKSIVEDIKYISPHEYLPKISFQLFEMIEKGKKKIGDPYGFCALWGIWYADNRITYKDISRDKLVNIMINNIREKNISFKRMIRNYSVDIVNMRDEILKKANIDINDWINDQYNDDQFNTILKEINIIINGIDL